jgi:pimeloyl-ACP methyl ester carboxylesterase
VTARLIDVRGREVAILEAGSGEPLVYLHGFADVHAAPGTFQPFHEQLARGRRLIAPALPGVNGSAELADATTIEDVTFHMMEVMDALGLDRFDLVGHCAGGWVAAEMAVRHPERVRRLGLVGATGLFVKGELIGDVFMHAQPERGVDYKTLRSMLFRAADHPIALQYFPNGRGDIDVEVRRYQMLRFGSFFGFRPPYFYHRNLRDRLYRAAMPSCVIWGGEDHMVPLAHGRAYAEGLGSAEGLHVLPGAGHAVQLEEPEAVAGILARFLAKA